MPTVSRTWGSKKWIRPPVSLREALTEFNRRNREGMLRGGEVRRLVRRQFLYVEHHREGFRALRLGSAIGRDPESGEAIHITTTLAKFAL